MGMTLIEKNIIVIDEQNNKYSSTYLQRAKGLAKNGRTRWVKDNTICLLCPPFLETEDLLMNQNIEYKYHCQHQAESFARAIIPVPMAYPLKTGLPGYFSLHFLGLTELAKHIYLDMAKQPEAYGLMLVDIESKDHNLTRNGYRTIHRFVDTLSNLSKSGELINH